jgi:hypothetical protein
VIAPVLGISATYRRGSSGPVIRLAQEWIALRLATPYPARVDDRELACALDGEFGPGTESAVKRFQASIGEPQDGAISPHLFEQLAFGMITALKTPLARPTLLETIVGVAQVHLKQGPREVGGDNRGPWVRLYCRGLETLPWCAGFASSVVLQAAELLGREVRYRHELACDLLAKDAQQFGAFLPGEPKGPPAKLQPGALFLVRATPGVDRKFHHTGLVAAVNDDHVETIEGNTNEGGSPNGFGVFARRRGYQGLDFIVPEAA